MAHSLEARERGVLRVASCHTSCVRGRALQAMSLDATHLTLILEY